MKNIEYIKSNEPDYEYRNIRQGRRKHIDILVDFNGDRIPIELKFRTAKASKSINDINILLTNHSAQDDGCYGFVRDILRIADFLDKEKYKFGYAVF